MELKYKPDFEEAKKYWRSFWKGEVIDRPLIISNIPKRLENPPAYPPSMNGIDFNFREAINLYEEYAENTVFFCESIPSLRISFGPDQVSYFLKGAEIKVVVNSRTAWFEPFIKDWEKVSPLEIDRESLWFKKFIEFYRIGAEKGVGKYLLEMPDLHTHLDCLRAIRGTENLCIDLIECPDEIKKRLEEIKNIYSEIYTEIWKYGNMEKYGSISWIPLYSENKFGVVQCDFISLIGEEMFRKFVLPYIEIEVNFLDNSVFHLDGPGALRHLDDILGIKKLDCIQWVPGVGNKPHIEWIDLLKKIKKRGKCIIVYPGNKEEIKIFHRELGPERVVYQYKFKDLKEGEEIKKYLKQHT